MIGDDMPLVPERVAEEEEEEDVQMYRSQAKRASRTARPADTSPEAMEECKYAIVEQERKLVASGLKRAATLEKAHFSWKTSTAPCGKGPGVKMQEGSDKQRLMNHMLSIKAKDLQAHNIEPYNLLGGGTVAMMYDRLLQVGMKTNAVQC